MLADSVPIYPLYSLLFADTGLSDAQISTLFLIWSTVGIVAEVPSGALADRFSRRAALTASGLLQAAGYVAWIAAPGYPAFAAGFVLWGLGGAFGSGALEALLYDGLASAGAEEHYPRIYGRITAVRLLSQLPVALAATVLFTAGGYDLVGWVSVACCLATAGVATLLPEARCHAPAPPDAEGDPLIAVGYVAVLRAGVTEAARQPIVRAAVVAVAVLGGLEALEEYSSLLAHQWGVTTSAVPLVLLGMPVLGAAGAALGGAAGRLRPLTLAVLLAVAVALVGGAALLRQPVGVAGVAVAYGLYQLVLVVTDIRLQQRVTGPGRATVTSVAALGMEVTAVALFAIWATGQPAIIVAVGLAVAAALPWLLRPEA